MTQGRRRENLLESLVKETPKSGSAVRSSINGNVKKLPFVMRNKRFFPSDFFTSPPKYGDPNNSKSVIRSEARKGARSLNRGNQVSAYKENKNLGLNPFKAPARKNSVKCRSSSNNK